MRVVSYLKKPLISTVGTNNEANRLKWLEQALDQIPTGLRLLDAGAGEQQFRKFCTHLEYISQDFAEYGGSGNDKGLQMGNWDYGKLDIVSDITAIPQPNESFDAIMCTEVFEHLPNPIAALKEFSRLLKKDGQLIITAPFCSLTHFAPYHFYSGFNRYFYETQLPLYDFEIIELKENGNFFEYLAQEIRRLPSIISRYSGKRVHKYESLLIKLILKILAKYAVYDSGSSELLCFGYHVRAVKK